MQMKKLLLAVTVLGMALAPWLTPQLKASLSSMARFADGSGWKSVAGLLEHDDYTVQTSDNGGCHSDLLARFPYVSLPHKDRSPQ
jgi:hypothetical protein